MAKIAITGHTGGVGKEIAAYFMARGDEIIGFTRTNGYTLPRDWKKVVLAAKDCDIFVNNARAYGNGGDMSQTLMLNNLCHMWCGQEKIIINIGSISGRNPLSLHPEYTCQKAALRKMAHIHQSKQLKPRIFHIDFGMMNTTSNAAVNALKMQPTLVARVIDFYLNFPEDILDITFRHREMLCPIE